VRYLGGYTRVTILGASGYEPARYLHTVNVSTLPVCVNWTDSGVVTPARQQVRITLSLEYGT